MKSNPLTRTVVNPAVRAKNIERLRATGAVLPTFSQLAHPVTIPQRITDALANVEADSAHPLNLFRVHWYNASDRKSLTRVPEHVVLPSSLTGVDAKIVVLFGNRFPMIRAHKVLAAYACLAPRIVTGEFDLATNRAIWPSTGNFCRGGIAISRILGCRGVAVLPQGMSQERFRWLENWVRERSDIVRTPGLESNVKEIYDACAAMSRDPQNIIFNQFIEYANYLIHRNCTGSAIADVFEELSAGSPSLRLRAFVSASGSAGTIGAGDALKEKYGTAIVAAEAVECPTMLQNGFGDHNIQGIGDKHVPLIHNVMNTDVVAAVSDRATAALNLVFNTPAGKEYLTRRRGVPERTVQDLGSFGLSSICNVIAAIKTAKYYRMGPADVVATVATDGAEMYVSELDKVLAARFGGRFDQIDAATAFGEYMLGADVDHLLEPNFRERERIFNIGYFTWVEQHGCSLEEFNARAQQSYWDDLQQYVNAWDTMIAEANAEAGARSGFQPAMA